MAGFLKRLMGRSSSRSAAMPRQGWVGRFEVLEPRLALSGSGLQVTPNLDGIDWFSDTVRRLSEWPWAIARDYREYVQANGSGDGFDISVYPGITNVNGVFPADITASGDPAQLMEDLAAIGVRVDGIAGNMVGAVIAPDQLDAIGNLSSVLFMTPSIMASDPWAIGTPISDLPEIIAVPYEPEPPVPEISTIYITPQDLLEWYTSPDSGSPQVELVYVYNEPVDEVEEVSAPSSPVVAEPGDFDPFLRTTVDLDNIDWESESFFRLGLLPWIVARDYREYVQVNGTGDGFDLDVYDSLKRIGNLSVVDGKIEAIIDASGDRAMFLEDLATIGVNVISRLPQSVYALISLDQLDAIGNLNSVKFIWSTRFEKIPPSIPDPDDSYPMVTHHPSDPPTDDEGQVASSGPSIPMPGPPVIFRPPVFIPPRELFELEGADGLAKYHELVLYFASLQASYDALEARVNPTSRLDEAALMEKP